MAVDMGIPDVEGADEIGRGGFGVVYRAEQRRFDRTVAVKVLEQAQLDEAGRQRFERECKALGALSGHPNVVTIYDSGFTPNAGWPYLVLEYLPDGSLGDRVDRDGPIDIDQTTELIIKICGALETAHRSGVLHRDMKPENILMGPYDEPKLGDFGIARVQGATMTATSTIWGSPAHAAPEIIEGKGASPQTDIYSLGSTLYVLLSGKLAFQRETDESIIPVLARIATEQPPDLRPIGVPQEVWAVVEKAMAKDPAVRQQTAMDVGKELQQARAAIGLDRVEMRVKGEQSTRRTFGGTLSPSANPNLTPGPLPAPTSAPTSTVSGATYTPPPGSPPPGSTAVPTYTPATGTTAVPTYTPAAGSAPPGYGATTGYPTGPAGPSGPISPYTNPGIPAAAGSSGGNGTKVALIAVIVAILVVAAGIGLFAATRGGSSPSTTLANPPPSVVGSSSSTGSTPASSTTTGAPVSMSDALLSAAQLPGKGWSVSSQASGFTGFSFLEPCNNPVDATALVQQDHTIYLGTTPGGKPGSVFQAVGEFKDVAAAKAFMDALPKEIECKTWTDSTGEDHDIIEKTVDQPVGDQSALLEDLVDDSGTKYDHDLLFYREGKFVGFITNLTTDPNDTDFSNQLLTLADDQLKQTIG